jgi:2,4-dienoyl-CoA reductase-like NADH-dependent reductase (Old Yellow Enzyme family)
MIDYYRQRASFGLIVTEGVYPDVGGKAYQFQPGIETAAQAAEWQRVADAVHRIGGTLVIQLMHAGRLTHPSITGTRRVVAPSSSVAPGHAYAPTGAVPYPEPETLTRSQIRTIIDGFTDAASHAIDAGADGVELNGANGYLPHQFLDAATNRRADDYGGSPTARARFILELTSAIAERIGSERTGLRLSPRRNIHGIAEADNGNTWDTYRAVATGIAGHGLAYISVISEDLDFAQELQRRSETALILNLGIHTPTSRANAQDLLASGAHAVAVGRMGLANPDLPERWRLGLAVNEPRPEYFYSGGSTGYTDYPTLTSVGSAARMSDGTLRAAADTNEC